MKKVTTCIHITQRNHDWLKQESERRGLSSSELIRRMIDAEMDKDK